MADAMRPVVFGIVAKIPYLRDHRRGDVFSNQLGVTDLECRNFPFNRLMITPPFNRLVIIPKRHQLLLNKNTNGGAFLAHAALPGAVKPPPCLIDRSEIGRRSLLFRCVTELHRKPLMPCRHERAVMVVPLRMIAVGRKNARSIGENPGNLRGKLGAFRIRRRRHIFGMQSQR